MFNKAWASAGIWLCIGLFLYALLRGLTAEGPLLVGEGTLNAGVLEIKRAADGHYYLKGRIDGHAVDFLVDTGASAVAISASLADRLGLTACRPVSARTANGEVRACIAQAGSLEFGAYRIERPEINVLPDLRGPALLGMSVLERFRIEQFDGVMRIAPP